MFKTNIEQGNGDYKYEELTENLERIVQDVVTGVIWE